MGEQLVNGIDVPKFLETVEAVKGDQEVGLFKLRVKNEWVMGTRNNGEVKAFYGAKEEHPDRKAKLAYDMDGPPVLLGKDEGPNPFKYQLIGLSGCVTTAFVANVAARGIEIKSLTSDLRGFLGLDPSIPVGCKEIRFTMTIDSDAPHDSWMNWRPFPATIRRWPPPS